MGLSMIETILKVWVHQHMSIGYVQGLNDMLVPFLLTFFPTWTDDGTPLDKKGKPMSQDRQDRGVSKVYWCFEGFLRCTQHETVLQQADKEIARISSRRSAWTEQPHVVLQLNFAPFQANFPRRLVCLVALSLLIHRPAEVDHLLHLSNHSPRELGRLVTGHNVFSPLAKDVGVGQRRIELQVRDCQISHC